MLLETKPILFNTEMVRALLEGRKTETRRLVKPAHLKVLESQYHIVHPEVQEKALIEKLCRPPYQPGDILYVRETWQYGGPLDSNDQVVEPYQYYYAADGDPFDRWLNDDGTYHDGMKWRPSIHMPKEAARIFLRVTDVRVERLQEIDEAGAVSEGCEKGSQPVGGGPFGIEDDPGEWTAREHFVELWDSTIKPIDLDRYGWAANPWVWVIEFERCEKL
ncbi:MAG: hypothetical protein IJP43_07675 [Oscillospiraceae bacterium]|nr:hypothetical protein [Oscillospiraceae bacterium]